MRPSDFARDIGMSRQAVNFLVGQLEEMGYLERRVGPGGGRRLVYLTKKGWKVIHVMWKTLRRIQNEWAEQVGKGKYAAFMAVLREVAMEGAVS